MDANRSNDTPVVGAKLPAGYQVATFHLPNGDHSRAHGPSNWSGPVRKAVMEAIDDTWEHFYVTHGARPRLRVTAYGYTDVITGHSVPHADVATAGGYAAAFRLRAERMRANADESMYPPMKANLQTIADKFEEIAQRLEVRRVTDDQDN